MSSGTSGRPGRRAYLLICLFTLALVLFPFLFWYYTWFGRKLSDSDIERKVGEMEAARKARDFKTSDGLRGELTAAGIVIENTKDGVRWRRK